MRIMLLYSILYCHKSKLDTMNETNDIVINSKSNLYDSIIDGHLNIIEDNNINNNEDEEENMIPAWLRYLPQQNYIKCDPKNKLPMHEFKVNKQSIHIENNIDNSVDNKSNNINDTSNTTSSSSSNRREYIHISRSCNPFGPYSSHAMNIENPIILNKKRNLIEDNNIITNSISTSNNNIDISTSSNNNNINNTTAISTSTNNINMIEDNNDINTIDNDNHIHKKKKQYRTNILEASELFSIVKLS